MKFSVAELEGLLPAYKAADAIRGAVKVADVVDTGPLEKALKELKA